MNGHVITRAVGYGCTDPYSALLGDEVYVAFVTNGVL